MPSGRGPFGDRLDRVHAAMAAEGCDAMVLSVGADLPWLTGYEAMPLERPTLLVVRPGVATLLVPALERPRVVERPDVFDVVAWGEAEDPIAAAAALCAGATHLAAGDQMWSRFLIDLLAVLPAVAIDRASTITGPLRAVKDAAELEALRAAGAAVDTVIGQLQAGEVALAGRTEAQVSADLAQRLLEAGHHRVNFAIVAAGSSAASPHHEAGDRVIDRGDVVLCDIGGTVLDAHGVGYCSDTTRCVSVGPAPAEVRAAYEVLHAAQGAAVQAATVGTSAHDVDAAARDIIAAAGHGPAFVHRTGHGIGVEAHEDPYIVAGDTTPLAAGSAFSVEPGIYYEGQFGLRLEDIVLATAAGPEPVNQTSHELIEL